MVGTRCGTGLHLRWLLVSLVTIAALVVCFSLSLTCPEFQIDGYNRYIGDYQKAKPQPICIASSATFKDMQSAIQLALSLLAANLGIYTILAARHVYSNHAKQSSISLTYAMALLQKPDPVRTVKLLLSGMKSEQDKRLAKGALLFLVVAIPFNVPVMTFLAPRTFTLTPVRFDEFKLEAAGITSANELALGTLGQKGWLMALNNTNITANYVPYSRTYPAIDRTQNVFNRAVFAATGVLNQSGSGSQQATSRSLSYFLTSDMQQPYGSGMQTIRISYPPGSKERTLGAVPLESVLLAMNVTVPDNASDFIIEQSMLLVDQNCSFINRASMALAGTADVVNLTYWGYPTLDISGVLVNNSVHSMEDIKMFAEMINATASPNVYYVRANPSLELGPLQVALAQQSRYNTTLRRIPIHSRWNLAADKPYATFFTASALGDGYTYPSGTGYVVGLKCRTNLVPIKFNSTIPAGYTFTRRISNYTLPGFTNASYQLVSTALNLTQQAAASMQLRDPIYGTMEPITTSAGVMGLKQLRAPVLAQVIKSCPSRFSDALGGDFGSIGSGSQYYSTQDSCIGTEFDLLLKAHLLYLSYIPSDLQQQWSWGSLEQRAHPDKALCAVMVAVLLVTGTMLVMTQLLVAGSTAGAQPEALSVMPWAGMVGADAIEQHDEVLERAGMRLVYTEGQGLQLADPDGMDRPKALVV